MKEHMAQKSLYTRAAESQMVDFTMKLTTESMLNLMLSIAGEDAQRNGFGVDVLTPVNRTWVLSRLSLEIDSRPEQYSQFDIQTWVSDNNRLISTRNFEASQQGKVIARAVSQWCMLDFEKRVPVSLQEIMPQMEPFVVDAASPCDPPRKLRPVEGEVYATHKVSYSDIDFNSHMNTMRYVMLIMDCLPLEFFREDRPHRLDIHFLHECLYGQELSIAYNQLEGVSQFEIRNAEGSVACRAQIEWK